MNAPLRRVGVVVHGAVRPAVRQPQLGPGRQGRRATAPTRATAGCRSHEYERQRGHDHRRRRGGAREPTPTDDTLKYLRRYPGGATYAHVVGYYRSISAATGHRADGERLPRRQRRRLFAAGCSRHVHRQSARRQRRADPRPAGRRRPRTTRLTTRPAAARWSRSTRAPARSWPWSSTPSFDPNPLVSHDSDAARPAYNEARQATRTTRCSTGRSASATRRARRSR